MKEVEHEAAPSHVADRAREHIVMDDQVFIRDLLIRMLERLGYCVLEATDGEERCEFALLQMKKKHPLLALSRPHYSRRMGGRETLIDCENCIPNCRSSF